MTPATTWNSRFAESIPRLIGIFTGKVHENSSDTPTSGSHNSLVRTPIRANFISLERGRRELSGRYACMTHFEFQKTSKTAPRKSDKKKIRARESRRIADSCRGRRAREAQYHHHAQRAIMARPACMPPVFYKTEPPPLSFAHNFARALGLP
uniref:Uncharacterized protein n=1 Tax=Fagus sylvatica TaxID=28930 RepID=A0A2N9FJ72_FAGSY